MLRSTAVTDRFGSGRINGAFPLLFPVKGPPGLRHPVINIPGMRDLLGDISRVGCDPGGYDSLFHILHVRQRQGTLGNLYNTMGDVPRAMDLYEQAGALFEQYGWYSNCAILYYNIGETWLEEGESGKARNAYQKALDFAQTANDSLWMAGARKGLGRTALAEKKPREALRYLYEAGGRRS